MKIQIEASEAQAIINELAERPWKSVAGTIGFLQRKVQDAAAPNMSEPDEVPEPESYPDVEKEA